MNQLTDLKEFLILHKIKIKESKGWYFITDAGDRWEMESGIFYKNGESVIEREFIKSFKKKKT